MKHYSFDDWDKLSPAEKDDVIREAWMRKVSIREYVHKPGWEHCFRPAAHSLTWFQPLGTDFDLKMLKDCGIATEGI